MLRPIRRRRRQTERELKAQASRLTAEGWSRGMKLRMAHLKRVEKVAACKLERKRGKKAALRVRKVERLVARAECRVRAGSPMHRLGPVGRAQRVVVLVGPTQRSRRTAVRRKRCWRCRRPTG